MALNPFMMIPFVFVFVVIVTINYVVFSIGLVHVPVVLQPFTVPLGVSGFVATGGDFRGSLLQFFDLAVSALIYYPFLKAWERVLVAREEASVQVEESRTRTPAAVRRRPLFSWQTLNQKGGCISLTVTSKDLAFGQMLYCSGFSVH
jgi:PTS system cellobiose-specific IIC component